MFKFAEAHSETVLGVERLIQVHFWDFGGQLIFYTTHPTYMSDRCLYFLVFDLSIGLEGTVADPDIDSGVNTNKSAMGNILKWYRNKVCYCNLNSYTGLQSKEEIWRISMTKTNAMVV